MAVTGNFVQADQCMLMRSSAGVNEIHQRGHRHHGEIEPHIFYRIVVSTVRSQKSRYYSDRDVSKITLPNSLRSNWRYAIRAVRASLHGLLHVRHGKR
jgi:hypothetical protein